MSRNPFEVLVLVRRGSEFLVVHRTPQHDAYWHVVSGGIEAGESAAAAAARELREETGLGTRVVPLGRRFAYPLAGESERVRSLYAPGVSEVVVECFAADAPPGWEPELDWEHDDYRWCSADEAVELLYWPEPREVLRAFAGRT